ncbi:MAG: hypothetical protein ACK4Y9_09880 [Hyphomonas sp.]
MTETNVIGSEPCLLPSVRRRIIEMVAVSAALGVAFLLVNYLHFQYVPVSVILYACILDLLIANILILVPYCYFRRRSPKLPATELTLTAAASNLLILLYAVMGPTVIDRSLSIYIVQKIDQRGGEVQESAMGDIFIEEYMPEMRLIDVRLTEQVTSGTVIAEEGCLILTPKGKALSTFAEFYRATFLPQKRILMDEQTDSLTDPFRNSVQQVDTACNRSG